MLSVVSQLGDLFESAVKRRSASRIRARSFPAMAACWTGSTDLSRPIVLAAIIGFLRGGADGVGRGLMVW